MGANIAANFKGGGNPIILLDIGKANFQGGGAGADPGFIRGGS